MADSFTKAEVEPAKSGVWRLLFCFSFAGGSVEQRNYLALLLERLSGSTWCWWESGK